jgi:hypothetical protein
MNTFPRTTIGGVSVPRLVCGCNSFLGYSHISDARDKHIKALFDKPSKMADVVEIFARNGCDAFLSGPTEFVANALAEVEQRTGVKMLWLATPGAPNMDEWKQKVDQCKKWNATFILPHQATTDPRLDPIGRCLKPELVEYLKYVREVGLVPGLSTHTPQSIVCSDVSGADVETYLQPYNAAGFFCQVETDWVAKVIRDAKKPVVVIKPLACGRLLPPTGFTFVWNTIRDCDLVAVGTMSTYEAESDIELCRSILEHRQSQLGLQVTRSKAFLVAPGTVGA